MTISEQERLAYIIFTALKVNSISIPIGKTDKGDLAIRFSTAVVGFEVLLDSVPLSTANKFTDEANIELKAYLEKYLFDPEM